MTLNTASAPEPARGLPEVSPETAYRVAKRALDVFVSTTSLVLLLPLILLIAVVIPLESRGPIFYTQERVGLNRRRRHRSMNGGERRRQPAYGQTFRILKFRSMVSDAERMTGAVWATSQDPRITRLGRFLRRTHLDELPQLLNVLRGEMSVVGPRPERPEIVARLAPQIPGYSERHDVLPGITGLAQVAHCYDSSLQTAARKLQYDLYYIRYANFLLDVKIMGATMFVMARAEENEMRSSKKKAPVLGQREANRANLGVGPVPGPHRTIVAGEAGRESTGP